MVMINQQLLPLIHPEHAQKRRSPAKPARRAAKPARGQRGRWVAAPGASKAGDAPAAGEAPAAGDATRTDKGSRAKSKRIAQASSKKTVTINTRRARRTTVWSEESQPKVVARPQAARPRASGKQVAQARTAGARPAKASDEQQRVVVQLPTLTKAAPNVGVSFARNRIRHAFEMFGSCMMILAFLALAMFA